MFNDRNIQAPQSLCYNSYDYKLITLIIYDFNLLINIVIIYNIAPIIESDSSMYKDNTLIVITSPRHLC